ncbi:unnamed protein product, partial [Durusdinium trenchii]
QTPLHLAALYVCGDVVKVLLAANAAVDAKNGDGRGPRGETPLDGARSQGHSEVVKILEAAASSTAWETPSTSATTQRSDRPAE